MRVQEIPAALTSRPTEFIPPTWKRASFVPYRFRERAFPLRDTYLLFKWNTGGVESVIGKEDGGFTFQSKKVTRWGWKGMRSCWGTLREVIVPTWRRKLMRNGKPHIEQPRAIIYIFEFRQDSRNFLLLSYFILLPSAYTDVLVLWRFHSFMRKLGFFPAEEQTDVKIICQQIKIRVSNEKRLIG